jgi:hypothetical protein
MAERQFIFNTNVAISENYATNFFNISALEITSRTDLSITTQEECAAVLTEMANIYKEIDTYLQRNIDEKNIYTLSLGLEDALKNLRPRYSDTISFIVTDINIPADTLYRTFVLE